MFATLNGEWPAWIVWTLQKSSFMIKKREEKSLMGQGSSNIQQDNP